MIKNVSSFGRLCRILIGACTACLGFFFAPNPLVMWSAISIGAVLICTGVVAFCPMCSIMKRK